MGSQRVGHILQGSTVCSKEQTLRKKIDASEKMKGFLTVNHPTEMQAGCPRQCPGLSFKRPLRVSRCSFLISLRGILLDRRLNIQSGFRCQLLLGLSERASCPAPGDSQAHGKPFCQGEKPPSNAALMPTERGLLPAGPLPRLPWVNSWGPSQIILLIAPEQSSGDTSKCSQKTFGFGKIWLFGYSTFFPTTFLYLQKFLQCKYINFIIKNQYNSIFN